MQVTHETIFKRLQNSPEWKAAEAAELQQLHDERKQTAAEIGRLEKEGARQAAALQKDLDAAQESLNRAMAAEKAAHAAFGEARRRLQSHHATHLATVGELRSRLAELAPPSVDSFLRDIVNLVSDVRSGAPVIEVSMAQVWGSSQDSWQRFAKAMSTLHEAQAPLRDLFSLLSESVEFVKSLRYSPLSDAEFSEQISSRRAAIDKALAAAGISAN